MHTRFYVCEKDPSGSRPNIEEDFPGGGNQVYLYSLIRGQDKVFRFN